MTEKIRQYKSLQALLERLVVVNARRKAWQREVDAAKAEEDALLAQGRELLKAKDVAGYDATRGIPVLKNVDTDETGLVFGARITRVTIPIATITDWPALVDDVLAKGVYAVIHKRVSPTQLELLSREGIFVKGVELALQEQAQLYVPRKKGA